MFAAKSWQIAKINCRVQIWDAINSQIIKQKKTRVGTYVTQTVGKLQKKKLSEVNVGRKELINYQKHKNDLCNSMQFDVNYIKLHM